MLPEKMNNMQSLWAKNYILLEEVENIEIPLKVFICKTITCTINKLDLLCLGCTHNLYIDDKCLNVKCSKYEEVNITKLIDNKNDDILMTCDFVENQISMKHNEEAMEVFTDCIKCRMCKKCAKGTKCTRHKICKHLKNIENKKYYHILNKLALRKSLNTTLNILHS